MVETGKPSLPFFIINLRGKMIIVNNLTKVFHQQNGEELYAVNDLSFTAEKGEIVVLL